MISVSKPNKEPYDFRNNIRINMQRWHGHIFRMEEELEPLLGRIKYKSWKLISPYQVKSAVCFQWLYTFEPVVFRLDVNKISHA